MRWYWKRWRRVTGTLTFDDPRHGSLAVLGAVLGALIAVHRRWGAEQVPCAGFEDPEGGISIIPMCISPPAAWWAVALAALGAALLSILVAVVIRGLADRPRAVSATTK